VDFRFEIVGNVMSPSSASMPYMAFKGTTTNDPAISVFDMMNTKKAIDGIPNFQFNLSSSNQSEVVTGFKNY